MCSLVLQRKNKYLDILKIINVISKVPFNFDGTEHVGYNHKLKNISKIPDNLFRVCRVIEYNWCKCESSKWQLERATISRGSHDVTWALVSTIDDLSKQSSMMGKHIEHKLPTRDATN